MRITFNPDLDIAYIYLREGEEEVTTISLSDDLHIDIAPDGGVYGIELLDARQQLFGSDGGQLEYENEVSEERVAVMLPH